jgi:hypothetical protein
MLGFTHRETGPRPHITGVPLPSHQGQEHLGLHLASRNAPTHDVVGVQAASLVETSQALPTAEGRARLLRLPQQMGPRDTQPAIHAQFHPGDVARVLTHCG